MRKLKSEPNYIFGIEYYRPPNPPRENWAEDLRQIAALGFNTIRCWLYWRTTEPVAGRWDFSDNAKFSN